MFYQIEQVLKEQPFDTEKFYKGRGILICETDGGLFALKEFRGHAAKAEHLFSLGEFLQEQGISCDNMVKNKDGNLLTQGVDGVRYSCHHWVKGRECDVRSRMDIVMTASFLARFHAVCADGGEIFVKSEKQGGAMPVDEAEGEWTCDKTRTESLYAECLRHDRELRRIRKYILHRKNKTDFERLYIAECSSYLEQSGRVLAFLERKKELLAQSRPSVCHGDFNQHNVVITSGGMTLVHMEHACFGSQTSDLCHFLRKMLEKHEWSDTLGLELLREYSRIRAMGEADWLELYCRLWYPEKFWKIANRYFQSNKVWDSGNYYEKLKKEIRQNRARQRFLETFRRAKL